VCEKISTVTDERDGQGDAAPSGLKKCFIVSPIGEDGSPIRKRSNQIKKYIIDPALSPLGYETTRSDLTDESGLITTQIVTHLLNADLIVADLTGHNPNVFYELAIRHASGKPFIQIIDKSERLPFDVAGQTSIFLDHKDLDSGDEAKEKIANAARAFSEGDEPTKTDNPVVQTIDLLRLRGSGNPEQITLAEVSESLAEIRSELRLSRARESLPGALTSQQTAVIRKVLLTMALDGRLTPSELDDLESVPTTKSFGSLVAQLRDEMAKPYPPEDDPWGSPSPPPPRTRKRRPMPIKTNDDEPPF